MLDGCRGEPLPGVGGGGVPASFPSRSPPPKQPFQPTPTPSPGFQEVVGKGPRPLIGRAPSPGGPGPKPLETWPTGPWGPPLFSALTSLTSCCVSNPWVGSQNPRHERRFPSSLQHFRRWRAPSPWGPQQAPEPCMPAA